MPTVPNSHLDELEARNARQLAVIDARIAGILEQLTDSQLRRMARGSHQELSRQATDMLHARIAADIVLGCSVDMSDVLALAYGVIHRANENAEHLPLHTPTGNEQ